MIITMDGEYAYRNDPYTPVRVLCVDRPMECSVVAMSEKGIIRLHLPDGTVGTHGEPAIDLVPLQRKPREFWINVYPSGRCVAHETKEEADCAATLSHIECVHVCEVLDEGGDA